jgi:hypothetical protein
MKRIPQIGDNNVGADLGVCPDVQKDLNKGHCTIKGAHMVSGNQINGAHTGAPLLICFLLLASHLLIPVSASASDQPFINPSNWGTTGLLEIPTARVMEEDSYRLGWT